MKIRLKLFLLALLSLTLTSCNDNDTPAPEPPVIIPENEKMVFFVLTEEPNQTVKLPLSWEVDCTIAWDARMHSDETKNVTKSYPTHTYPSSGLYFISVAGKVTALNSNGLTQDERDAILGVQQWGKTGLTELSFAFKDCTELRYLPDDTEGAFEEVSNFTSAFAGCTALEEIPAGLFAKALDAYQYNDVFAGCTALKAIPAGLFAEGGVNFEGTFKNCTTLTAIPEDLFAGSPVARSFQATFQNCTALTAIPAGLFDNNQDTGGFTITFDGCTNLSGESPYTLVDGEKVHLYERDPLPTASYLCFHGCTGLSDYGAMPALWR